MPDDDDNGGLRALRLPIVAGLIVCLAGFKSWQEFRFATSGQHATATITKITESRHRGRTNGFKLFYDFSNKNTNQPAHHFTLIDVDEVGLYSEGQSVEIDYYGEKYPTTRLHGTSNRGWVYFFFGSLAVLIAVITYLALKSAREAAKPRTAKKKR